MLSRDRCKECCLLALVLLVLFSGCAKDNGSQTLFQDDFDSPRSGWGGDRREQFERGYEDGEYFIELHRPNWFAWTYPGKQFDNVNIEVDVHLASGSPDSHFGVLCRHVDLNNFYYFAISADGFYAIFRRVDGGDLESLTGDDKRMSPSPAIRTGEQSNHLLIACQGNELSLYVNGQLLETVTDDAHARGDVGIGAGSGPEGDARIQFDNFVATKP